MLTVAAPLNSRETNRPFGIVVDERFEGRVEFSPLKMIETA
jgi:hypothetical protein